jgi:cardiolipin synthase
MHSYIHAEKVGLVFSGNHYFDLLSEIISSAKEIIHIQTYIIEEDATGKEIIEKLKLASGRGVQVYFLADAFGSRGLSGECIQKMKSSGIKFRSFSPLFSSEGIFLGRRLHHKIVVADKNIALIGGINIADKYHGTERDPPWLDFAIMIKGSCCEYLHNLSEEIFNRKKKNIPEKQMMAGNGGPLIRFRTNDWVRGKNEIHKSYKETLLKAEKNITILASYFLPGFMFQKLLRKAAARGVKIKIIVTGKTDVPFFHLAEKYMYNQLLGIGAEVYEWKNSIMHGKIMVADDQWVTIGSYNINYLSHYRSIELNADILDETFTHQVFLQLEEIMEKHCDQITREWLQAKRGLLFKLKTKFAYHFIRLFINIFLPKKRMNI